MHASDPRIWEDGCGPVLRGHYNYYGVPRNGRAMNAFSYFVGQAVVPDAAPKEPENPNQLGANGNVLSNGGSPTQNQTSLSGATTARLYPRQEPSAVVPHAGICAGGAG